MGSHHQVFEPRGRYIMKAFIIATILLISIFGHALAVQDDNAAAATAASLAESTQEAADEIHEAIRNLKVEERLETMQSECVRAWEKATESASATLEALQESEALEQVCNGCEQAMESARVKLEEFKRSGVLEQAANTVTEAMAQLWVNIKELFDMLVVNIKNIDVRESMLELINTINQKIEEFKKTL